MLTVGFIGYGNVNSVLAKHAVQAGYKVVLSNSRGPESLRDAVETLGPLASAATVENAVRLSDLISLSVPFKAAMELPAELFIGKIVMDSTNYVSKRDGSIADIESARYASSEYLQRSLPGSAVVKVFNSILFFHLASGARPVNHPERWALPLAGDDASAKATVATFVSDIGFDPVDCGSIAESWRFEYGTHVYCSPYMGEIPAGATPREIWAWAQTDHSRSVKEADILALVAKAEKGVRVDTSVINGLHGTVQLALRGE